MYVKNIKGLPLSSDAVVNYTSAGAGRGGDYWAYYSFSIAEHINLMETTTGIDDFTNRVRANVDRQLIAPRVVSGGCQTSLATIGRVSRIRRNLGKAIERLLRRKFHLY